MDWSKCRRFFVFEPFLHFTTEAQLSESINYTIYEEKVAGLTGLDVWLQPGVWAAEHWDRPHHHLEAEYSAGDWQSLPPNLPPALHHNQAYNRFVLFE